MVNVKNTKNILIKNLFDASIGSICWWALGFGLASGTSSGFFIGTDGFGFVDGSTDTKAGWFFQWAFAATAATIAPAVALAVGVRRRRHRGDQCARASRVRAHDAGWRYLLGAGHRRALLRHLDDEH